MIIWLNGAFGAGKTTTAAAVLAQLPGSRLFDPETVGHLLRENLPDHPVSDFQQWPPWRGLVVETAVALTRFTGEDLIASQTVLVESYAEEIFGGLRAADQDVLHVLLDAEEPTLRDRIERCDEAREWRLRRLDDCTASRSWLRARADLVINTEELAPLEVAREVVHAAQAVRAGRARTT